jgi:predicted DsbA family dithiol-disulfide isomerase
MLAHLNQVAQSLGLPFGERKKTYNSRLAQELGLWAETRGRGRQFHLAAFYAYFAKGQNLAKKDVLLELAATAGLGPTDAAKVIEERSFSSRVLADWQLSRNKGITAVPTFIMNDSSLTGARPYDIQQTGYQLRESKVFSSRITFFLHLDRVGVYSPNCVLADKIHSKLGWGLSDSNTL